MPGKELTLVDIFCTFMPKKLILLFMRFTVQTWAILFSGHNMRKMAIYNVLAAFVHNFNVELWYDNKY